MTVLVWDTTESRIFETGIDRGVAYIGTTSIPWNGLTSVEDQTETDTKVYSLDGQKYLESQTLGVYKAQIKAFTYPEELDVSQLFVNLTYRTRIGESYKIHVIFGAQLSSKAVEYNTEGDNLEPVEFEWVLSTTPPISNEYRSASHLIFETEFMYPPVLDALEAFLYGTEDEDPDLSSPEDFLEALAILGSITITDNGDGTWTASGPDYAFDTIGGDPTTFEINGVDATYLDADTYQVGTTFLRP